MNGYDKFEILKQKLGIEKAFDELLQALSEKEKQENAEYIAGNWDIDFEEEEIEND